MHPDKKKHCNDYNFNPVDGLFVVSQALRVSRNLDAPISRRRHLKSLLLTLCIETFMHKTIKSFSRLELEGREATRNIVNTFSEGLIEKVTVREKKEKPTLLQWQEVSYGEAPHSKALTEFGVYEIKKKTKGFSDKLCVRFTPHEGMEGMVAHASCDFVWATAQEKEDYMMSQLHQAAQSHHNYLFEKNRVRVLEIN